MNTATDPDNDPSVGPTPSGARHEGTSDAGPPGAERAADTQNTSAQDYLNRFLGAIRDTGLRRSPDGWIAGVCSGIARRMRLDPLVVRALFILLALVFGAGITLYLVAWLLLPDAQGRIKLQSAVRGGDNGAVALLVVTLIAVGSGFGWIWGWDGATPVLPLLLVCGIGWYLWQRSQTGPGQQSTTEPFANAATGAGPTTTGSAPAFSGTARPTTGGAESGAGGTPPPGVWQSSVHPTPPVPPPPPGPRRRRLGAAWTMILLGLTVVVASLTPLVLSGSDLDDRGGKLAWVAAAAVLGCGTLIAGLVGRRAGFAGFMALLAAGAAALAALFPNDLTVTGPYGEAVWTPTTANAARTHDLSAGDGTLDLRALRPTTPTTVTTNVSLGQLRIRVPAGTSVRIEARTDAGEIRTDADIRADSGFDTVSGTDLRRTVTVGPGPALLTVRARVGLGSLSIERTS